MGRVTAPRESKQPPRTDTGQRLATAAPRVLVIDDEHAITQLIEQSLRRDGWQVATAHTGSAGLAQADAFEPDVIVLDRRLPDFTDLQVLTRLRQLVAHTPILLLTALDSVDDRVHGLASGGDDYLTKPFSIEELIARLRALVRRAHAPTHEATPLAQIIRVGDLSLNEETYEVQRDGAPINLTATEFELLRYLMLNQRRVLSKTQILNHVWRYDPHRKPTRVELYISYLRKKIDSGRAPMIHTVRGSGYLLKAVNP